MMIVKESVSNPQSVHTTPVLVLTLHLVALRKFHARLEGKFSLKPLKLLSA